MKNEQKENLFRFKIPKILTDHFKLRNFSRLAIDSCLHVDPQDFVGENKFYSNRAFIEESYSKLDIKIPEECQKFINELADALGVSKQDLILNMIIKYADVDPDKILGRDTVQDEDYTYISKTRAFDRLVVGYQERKDKWQLQAANSEYTASVTQDTDNSIIEKPHRQIAPTFGGSLIKVVGEGEAPGLIDGILQGRSSLAAGAAQYEKELLRNRKAISPDGTHRR